MIPNISTIYEDAVETAEKLGKTDIRVTRICVFKDGCYEYHYSDCSVVYGGDLHAPHHKFSKDDPVMEFITTGDGPDLFNKYFRR